LHFKDETNNELHITPTCRTREKDCDCWTSKVCDPPHICLWISWDCFGPETPCPQYSCQSQFQQHRASHLILDLSSLDPGRFWQTRRSAEFVTPVSVSETFLLYWCNLCQWAQTGSPPSGPWTPAIWSTEALISFL